MLIMIMNMSGAAAANWSATNNLSSFMQRLERKKANKKKSTKDILFLQFFTSLSVNFFRNPNRWWKVASKKLFFFTIKAINLISKAISNWKLSLCCFALFCTNWIVFFSCKCKPCEWWAWEWMRKDFGC